jgi:hypothetical protein
MARWFLLASALLATLSGASAFVTPTRSAAAMPARAPRTTRGVVRMGKMAKVSFLEFLPPHVPSSSPLHSELNS